MEVSEEVLDFERGEYSGVAWMIGEFYTNFQARLDENPSHICTEKFNFKRASIEDIQHLRDGGYGVRVNNG